MRIVVTPIDLRRARDKQAADRIHEALHVIVAFTRVGSRYFRCIDLSKLPLGFVVFYRTQAAPLVRNAEHIG